MHYDVARAIGVDTFFDGDGDNSVQVIKDKKGKLYGLVVENLNAAAAWIQLFDESGTITVGTTTPKLSFPVPDDSGAAVGALNLVFSEPIKFQHSIKFACTTTATGNTDPTTGLIVNAFYL